MTQLFPKGVTLIDYQLPAVDAHGHHGQTCVLVLLYRFEGRAFRMTIVYDSYKSQSHGTVQIWTAGAWSEVYRIHHGAELAVNPCYSSAPDGIDYTPDVERLHHAAVAVALDKVISK